MLDSIFSKKIDVSADSLTSLVQAAHTSLGFDFELKGNAYYIVDHQAIEQGSRVSTNRLIGPMSLKPQGAADVLSNLMVAQNPKNTSPKPSNDPHTELQAAIDLRHDSPIFIFVKDAKINDYLASKKISLTTDNDTRVGELLWRVGDQVGLEFYVSTVLDKKGKGSCSFLTATRL